MRVNILVNRHRLDAMEAAADLVRWLHGQGITVGSDPESAARIGAHPTDANDFANAELVVTLGGDGTLIRAANWCSRLGTPILGVNYGRFGFVCQCQPPDAVPALETFLAGKAEIEERMMLTTDLIRNRQSIVTLHSLNESLIHRNPSSGLVVIDVSVDGDPITGYPADGVMVSTPTGSTAYNLSAGGPLADPLVHALLLSAIAPHTLSARPLILRADAVVEFRVEADGDAMLIADGQVQLHILSRDVVRVARSDRVTRLVRAGYNDFLRKLGEKLLWSQRPASGAPSEP